jgi:hypothetical protein
MHKHPLRSRKEAGSPRESRSKVVERARLDLLRNPAELVDRMLKGQAKIDKFNAADHKPPRSDLVNEVRARALKAGKFLTSDEQFNIQRLGRAGIPGEFNKPPLPDPDQLPQIPPEFRKQFAWYDELQRRVPVQVGAADCTQEVDLDEVSPMIVTPGVNVSLSGTCFGDNPGAVLLRILPDPNPIDLTFPNIVELQIYSWSSTFIEAYLPRDFAGFRLSGAEIWVRTAVYNYHSNSIVVTFSPGVWTWLGSWQKEIFGGWNGESKSGTFLSGRVLGNPDFSIAWAEISHSGSGWAELRAPNAGGQNLEQGWHIGVGAARHAQMSITYRLEGPAGVDPPQVPELYYPWGLFST